MGNYSSFKLSKLHVGGVSSPQGDRESTMEPSTPNREEEVPSTFRRSGMDGSPPGVFVITGKRLKRRPVDPTTPPPPSEVLKNPQLRNRPPPMTKMEPNSSISHSPHASPMPFNRVLSAQPTQVTDDSCFACTDATSSIDNTMVADRRSYTPLLSAPASEG